MSRFGTGWNRDPTRVDGSNTRPPWARPDFAEPPASNAEDYEMVADTLRRIMALAARVDVVAIATNAAEAVEQVLRQEPHVVIMDHRFPDMHRGTKATTGVGHTPATKVLIVIASDQPDVLDTALDAGRASVFPIRRSMTAPSRGRSPVRTIDGRGRDPVGALTRRQTEVLAIMAEGLSDQAIADRLTLSLNTIRTHVQTILRKLDAHSKLEAVALANRQHLFD